MDIVKSLMSQFGPSIVKGIAGNLGLGSNETESALGSILPTLLGGMADGVGTSSGAEELFKTVTAKENSGGLLDNLGSAFGGDSGSTLLKAGAALLPMLLGGQSKSSTLIDIAGRVLGVGGGKSKSLMSLAAPVLLNFIGKKVLGDGLNAGGLKDLILGQREHIGARIPSEISKEMGWGSWAKASTGHSSSEREVRRETTASSARETAVAEKKGGGMKWLWPLLLLGLLGFLLYSLMGKGCNSGADHKEHKKEHVQKDHRKGDAHKHDARKNETRTNTQTNTGAATRTNTNTTTSTQTNSGITTTTTTTAGGAAGATAAAGAATSGSAGGSTATYTGVASQFNTAASSGSGIINFGNVSPDGKVLSSAAKATFDQVAAIMKANPNMSIDVRGHNADKGGAAKNAAAKGASKVRAGLVQAYLITKGIKGSRISTSSLGHSAPIAGKDAKDEGNKRISIAIK